MIFKISQKAFSLVEIMVAIAIVAIITAIAATSLSAIQKTGRDTQRQSDLRTIQSALQQYYADVNKYPNTMSTELGNGGAFNNCTGRVTTPTCVVSKTYLTKLPKDPFGTAYYFRPVVSSAALGTNCDIVSGAEVGVCHYYVLCANMENPPNGSTCYNSSYDYQITPL